MLAANLLGQLAVEELAQAPLELAFLGGRDQLEVEPWAVQLRLVVHFRTSAPAPRRWRSSPLTILPTALCGSSSMNTT